MVLRWKALTLALTATIALGAAVASAAQAGTFTAENMRRQ